MLANQWNRVCRTCLTPEIDEDTCKSLCTVIELENGNYLEISKIIENCVNLEVTNTDECMPQNICSKCTSIIRNFYVFRDKCHKNDTYLREQLTNQTVINENKIKSLSDRQPRSVEEVKILLSEIENLNHEEKVVNNLSKEVNVFEDCPDDLIYDNSSNDCGDHPKDLDFNMLNSDDGSESSQKCTNTFSSSKLINIEEANEEDELHKTFHKCDICFEMFDNRKELLFHRRANHIHEISEDYYTIVKKDNKTHYICKICNRFCKHKDILRVHLRSHTGEKPYKCAVCSQSFAQKWHSRKHMKIHNLETIEKKPAIFYKCGSCKEGFESEIAVKIHYEQHHPANKQKEKTRVVSKPIEKLCDICGKFMKDLTEHLRWHAGNIKNKHECKICGRILTTSSSLSKHRQRHSDEKKFVCDTCGKRFKTKPDLTLHRKIHFEVPKHECQLCGRKFLHNNRLRIHLRVHAGEKPYQVYDNRKKEKRRLQRLERIKNSTSSELQSTKEIRKSETKTNGKSTSVIVKSI